MSDAGLPVAGWYEDPSDGSRARWWDGSGWTQHTRLHPSQVEQADGADAQPPRRSRHSAEPVTGADPAPAAPASTDVAPRAVPAAPVPGLWTQPAPQPYIAPHPTVAPPAVWAAPPPPNQYGGALYNPAYDAYRGKNSAAAWALALGIISVALLLLREILGYAPGLTGIGAVIWGVVGVSRARHIGVGRVRAMWGFALGAFTLVLFAVNFVVMAIGMIGPHYDRARLESSIVQSFSRDAGMTVTASCPVTAPMSAGSSFSCTATDGSGVVHTIDVHVSDDKGSLSWVATR